MLIASQNESRNAFSTPTDEYLVVWVLPHLSVTSCDALPARSTRVVVDTGVS